MCNNTFVLIRILIVNYSRGVNITDPFRTSMLVRYRWIELSVVVGSGGTLVPLYISLLTAIFTLIVVAHDERLTIFRKTHRYALDIVRRSCHCAAELLFVDFLSYSFLGSLHINFHRFALYFFLSRHCWLRQWYMINLYLVWFWNLCHF